MGKLINTMKTSKTSRKTFESYGENANKSTNANHQCLKGSIEKSKSKTKRLKSQLKSMICQTSSSSFICESVKDKLNIGLSNSESTNLRSNSSCLVHPRTNSFQLENIKQDNHLGKEQSISKSKGTSVSENRSRPHLAHIISLPVTTDLLKNEPENLTHLFTGKQYGKSVSAKPAIVKMRKKNIKTKFEPDSDFTNPLEQVLGLNPPVQCQNNERKNTDNNEQMDFLLNVIKTTTLTDKNFSKTKQHNISKTPIERKNKIEVVEQSSLPNIDMQIVEKSKETPFKNNKTNNPSPLGSRSTANTYKLGSSKFLVLLSPESSFYLVGITEVQLLSGSVDVLGYNMAIPKEKQIIFSLHGSSHLCIKASKQTKVSTTDGKQFETDLIGNVLSSHGVDSIISERILEEAKSKSVFILSKVKGHLSSTVWPNFFECHSAFLLFPPKDFLNDNTRKYHSLEYEIDCILDDSLQTQGLKEFKTISEWPDIAKGIIAQDKPKTILCGGKSVGKSSLLRYFANSCMSKWDKVIVIDFDLGQCEFTLPGCISVTLVENPLLGPNYTHLKEPLRSVFLGEVDVTKCPESYIDGCKLLIDHVRQHYNHLPWLINTMGFTRGFGITVTSGIISAVNPTHVVQIESQDRKLNYPSTLEPCFVLGQNISSFVSQQPHLNYRLHVLQSGSEQSANESTSQTARGMSPVEARNLVILSYLSEMLNAEKSHLSQVTPHMVKISELTLLTTSQFSLTKNQIAMTMNGNLIALCHLIEENFPNCLGFGIVRAIDWSTGVMYIITPMPAESLRKVNCMIKGNVSLPESLYLNQSDHIVGHVPYTALTSSQATSRFVKRDFRSLPTTASSSRHN